ncbi:MAG: HlyD family type I secretion periplasmic adaptor subunit [Rickettsiales bacterium]
MLSKKETKANKQSKNLEQSQTNKFNFANQNIIKKILCFLQLVTNKLNLWFKSLKALFLNIAKLRLKTIQLKKVNVTIKKNLKYFYLKSKKFILLLARADAENIARLPIKWGMLILAVFLTIFLIWGVIAPINSSSIANGKIVLDFNKKTIQHLEGGIIEKILVQEGQEVVTGETLIYMSDIQTRSQTEMLRKQLLATLAIEARLTAERLALAEPDFESLTQKYGNIDNKEILAKVIATQQDLFLIRKNTLNSKIDILDNRIEQIKDEITGIKAQKNAVVKELKLLAKQYKIYNKLVQSNNFPLNRLLDLEKQIVTSQGRKGELIAALAKAEQSILEAKLEILNLQNENFVTIQAELQEIELKISDLTEQLNSTKDVLTRTVIKSPVSGIVTDLKYHTIGAVISPASEIMYIVPKDDEMIIEARVNPQDIDNVQKGLEAKVQLTAYKAKKAPKLLAEILSVSADILFDEITGEQYFLARIRIMPGELEKLKDNIKLYPGMPVSVFIITGSRSLMKYLFSPITEAAYKAFREE